MFNSAALAYGISAALVVVGVLFGLHERRVAALLGVVPLSHRSRIVAQTRRRLRVAALFVFLGLLTACGHATVPKLHPIRYMIIWGLATLFAMALLIYGLADAAATRRRRMTDSSQDEAD